MAETYIDILFNLGGAAVTTLTQMNSGTSAAAGTYSPKANGFLQDIAVELNPQAASSLAQSGYITLVCTAWAPVNTMTIGMSGFGLATAPQLYGGVQGVMHWPVNLPVNTALPITGSVIYVYSPVTPFVQIVGSFLAT